MKLPFTGRSGPDTDPRLRIDALARAMDLLGPDVPDDVADRVARALAQADERTGLDPHTTVVALAGSTGSGKSSLFNALTGADLAQVGVLRPTTTQALAAVPPGRDVGPLVDWIGVGRRVLVPSGAGVPEGVVLVDTPDIDSVSESNSGVARRLAERVDLLVWVLDPQKYADQVVHAQWIAPLARHAGTTLAVLAQVDLLEAGDRRAVEVDLQRLLAQDGATHAQVIGISSVTGEGVEDLRRAIGRTATRVRETAQRVQDVLDDAVDAVAGDLDLPEEAPALDTDGLEPALGRAVGDASGAERVAEAVGAAYRHRAGLAMGWLPVRWLRRFRADPLSRLHLGGAPSASVTSREAAPVAAAAQLSVSLRRVVDEIARGRPQVWQARVRHVAREAADGLAPRVDQAIAGTDLGMAEPPRWWAWSRTVQWIGWIAAAVGFLWAVGVWAVGEFLLVEWTPPMWRGLPWPTWLVAGGLALTLLAVVVSAAAAAVGRRRRARRARAALDSAVQTVVGERLVRPLTDEVDRQRQILEALTTAARRPQARRR